MTTEEKFKVLEALHIIKRECHRTMLDCGHFADCDMYDSTGEREDECSLQVKPMFWELPQLPAYNGEPSFKEWNK